MNYDVMKEEIENVNISGYIFTTDLTPKNLVYGNKARKKETKESVDVF